jgi:hypothetical protein
LAINNTGTTSDTTSYKPVVIGSDGKIYPFNRWVGGSGGSFINNGTSQQTSANFNIDGLGKARYFVANGTTAAHQTSGIAIDHFAAGNYSRLWSYGPDASTKAGFQFYGMSNDGSVFATYLDLKSTGVVQMPGYGAGGTSFDGSGNLISASDRRVKHSIKPFNYGLSSIMKLKPSTFIYNQDSSNTVMNGFIAQDVQKVIPGAVHAANDEIGTLSLETNAIIAALVNAVKELNEKVEKLEAELKAKK